jgi:ribosomal protein L16 Arg81 hydroxylase
LFQTETHLGTTRIGIWSRSTEGGHFVNPTSLEWSSKTDLRRPVIPTRFQDLIHPVGLSEFFAHYWEDGPFRISRSSKNRCAAFFKAEDLETIVTFLFGRSAADIHLISRDQEGATQVDRAGADYTAVQNTLAAGGSVRLGYVERVWPPIGAVCASLSQTFGCPATANIYWTPKSARGLGKHFDLHDVIIVQVLGSKGWRLFGSPHGLPIQHFPLLAFEETSRMKGYRRSTHDATNMVHQVSVAEKAEEFFMKSDDFLYIPRGYIHEAFTTEEESVHITFAIHSVTALDVLTVALGQAATRTPWLRKGLVPGYHFRSHLQDNIVSHTEQSARDLLEHLDIRAALRETLTSLHEAHPHNADDAVPQAPLSVGEEGRRRLCLRRGVFGSATREPAGLVLRAGGKKVTLPHLAATVVERILSGASFSPSELVQTLDRSSVNALLQVLIREGIVSFVE